MIRMCDKYDSQQVWPAGTGWRTTPHKATREKPEKGPFLGYDWAGSQDKPGSDTTPGLDLGLAPPGSPWGRSKNSHPGETRQKILGPVGGQRKVTLKSARVGFGNSDDPNAIGRPWRTADSVPWVKLSW